MLCKIFSAMRVLSHQPTGIHFQSWDLARLRPEKHIEGPSLREEGILLLHVWHVSLRVQQDLASMSVEQRFVA